MTFPLKFKKIIRGFQDHIKAGLGGATDYVANHETVYAPIGGKLEHFQGPQGGNWLRIIREDGEKWEFAHLKSYVKKPGPCNEGDHIAVSGNSGELTTGPHLHLQITDKNGQRIDPESYFFAVNIPIVALNGEIPFLQQTQNELLRYSAGQLTISWDRPVLPVDDPNQDEVYALLDKFIAEHPEYSPNRYFLIFSRLPNAFARSYYYPKHNCCISVIPPGFNPRLVVFELAHQFQYFYNENRDGLPHIEVVDSNYPSDELIWSKLKTVLPYTHILNKKKL